jgi:hypothetical protein
MRSWKRTQAAAWTGAKIRAGEVKPEDAAKHYGDFAPKYEAMATYEQTPGAGTGYLEGIVGMPYETRLQHSNKASWTNPKGQDSIYSSGGMITEPTRGTVGAYTPSGTNVLEINPGNVGRPLVTTSEGSIRPNEAGLLDLAESARAYVDVQNAGAWHKVVPNSQTKVGDRTSLNIALDESPTPEKMAQLSKIAEENGFFAVDTGKGINLINDPYSTIGGSRTGKDLRKQLDGDLGKQLDEVGLGRGERVKIETGYQDYEQAWQAGTGSGEATAKFLGDLSKNEVFSKSIEPALRAKAAQNLARDVEFAKQNGLPMREDIVNALRILSEQGVKGLQKAVDSGAILPAIVGSIVSPAVIRSLTTSDGSQREM